MFKSLKPEALRKAVHRAFKLLEAHGVVKLEKRPGKRGLDALYARLVSALDIKYGHCDDGDNSISFAIYVVHDTFVPVLEACTPTVL
jgi:hypothetical protein